MSYSNNILSSPVTIADIRQCLGESSNELEALCKSDNINRWAKYKPVSLASKDTMDGQFDTTTGKWKSTSVWWKGSDGHCGLSFTDTNTISSSWISNLINGYLQWTYVKPSGGSTSYYRQADFIQYFHAAVPPVGLLAGAGRTIYVGSSGSGMRTLTLNYDSPNEGDLNLTLADFSNRGVSLTQYFLGVLLYVSASKYRIVTSGTKIGNTGSTLIECQIGYSDIGTWRVMPFISSIQIDAYSYGQTGRFMSAGYGSADTITIASSGSVYRIDAIGLWSNTSYTQIGIQVTVVNNNSSSKTFSGSLRIYIYETNDDATTGAGGTLKAQYTYSTTFTVSANSSYTIPAYQYSAVLQDYFVTFMNVTRQVGKEYWVTARFVDGTSIDNQYEPVQDVIMPDL